MFLGKRSGPFFIVLAFILLLGSTASAQQLDPPNTRSRVTFITAPPTVFGPADGTKLVVFSPLSLAWQLPTGSTQYHLQVVPANNDGPGINVIRNADDGFIVNPPTFGVGPFVLLPSMTYTWRVRATDLVTGASDTDPVWSPWSPSFKFSTPPASSETITLSSPPTGSTALSLNPTLNWTDTNRAIFYYEIQLSEDPTFNTDPATATRSVYTNLVHGGITFPVNTWTVPANAPLRPGTTYHWRMRPRVQGDGTPVAWSTAANFTTPGTPQPDQPPVPVAPTAAATPAPTGTPGPDGTPIALATPIASASPLASTTPSVDVTASATATPSGTAVRSKAPDLATTDVSVSPMTAAAGSSVQLSFVVSNLGDDGALAADVHALISSDVYITKTKTDLGSVGQVPALGVGQASSRQTASVTIPGATAPGIYFIGVYADWANVNSTDSAPANNGLSTMLTVTACTANCGAVATATPSITCPAGQAPLSTGSCGFPTATGTATLTPTPLACPAGSVAYEDGSGCFVLPTATPTLTPISSSSTTCSGNQILVGTDCLAPTPTWTPLATATATASPTVTATPTFTPTGSPAATPAATDTPTQTPTLTATATPTATAGASGSTSTPTNTATSTPVPPTATSTAAAATNTPVPPTATNTPAATNTATATSTPTRTSTPVPTATVRVSGNATGNLQGDATSTGGLLDGLGSLFGFLGSLLRWPF